jgi:Leu/Phe-tRNA-protein transferase
MKRPKKKFFEKQVWKLTYDIAERFPRCSRPLDPRTRNWIKYDIQRLVNRAYRHGFGRGMKDGLDNPLA